MFARDLVVSGFDTETLVSEEYLSYLLLAQVEAGIFKLYTDDGVWIHPPGFADYRTSYRDSDSALLPAPVNPSFQITLLPDQLSPIRSLAFTDGDDTLLVHSADGRVRAWNYKDRSEVDGRGFEVPSTFCSAFDYQTYKLAIAVQGNAIELWDIASKVATHTLTGHTLAPVTVTFSRGGERVASGSLDTSVRVWDTSSGAPIAVFEEHTSAVNAVALDNSGVRAVSGDGSGTLHLWDVDTGAIIRSVDHGHPVFAVAITGDVIAAAGGGGDITIWNAATGALMQTLSGHEGNVTALEFAPIGLRLISAGADRTARIWSATGEVSRDTRHRAPLTAVRYSQGGSRTASGSDSGVSWIFDSHDASRSVEVRPYFCQATFRVSQGDSAAAKIDLYANVDLVFENGANGLERRHALQIGFARFTDISRAALEGERDVPALEQYIRDKLDREVPLNIAGGQSVQQIRMRKFVTDEQRTLGFYVDLALRAGPEADNFVPKRGDVTKALDFRGADDVIAFATSPDLFALFGPDFKYKLAEESEPGSGEFNYPLRNDPFDQASEKMGTIQSVSAGPQRLLDGTPTGKLRIAINAEVDVAYFPDPDVTVTLTLDPTLQPDKSVEWPLHVDFNAGLLTFVISAVVGAIVFVVGGGVGAIVGWMLVTLLAEKLIAEPVVAKIIESDIDEEKIASLFDAMPFHLPAARRTWDPFYETLHTVQALLDEKPVIDDKGLAFVASAVRLDRKPRILADRPIRDELRDGSGLAGVFYRISDYESQRVDFEEEAPGTDRQSFAGPDVTGVPDMVALTVDEIVGRKPKGQILAPQTMYPKRIHVVEGQIDQLLCVTGRERAELSDQLINEFRIAQRQKIRDDEGDGFKQEAMNELQAELGRSPTQAEINARVTAKIDARYNEVIGALQQAFEENILPERLETAIAKILRFDLPPEEMYVLQKAGVLTVDGAEIIKRTNADGSKTVYFRDKPDGNPNDNLLSLAHYSPPYTPPV